MIKLNYQAYDLYLTIEPIKMVRKYMVLHLVAIATDDWQNYSYKFDEEHVFNLQDALKHYINHITFHKELIDRNIKLYQNK